ncbi:MAG: IS6 family transposase [Salinarimonadaceae bacterium]|nr:MAG: IS6 family transposase [Salinarimonadaceae bacterium]
MALYIRFPLSPRNVEVMLHVHGIKISHESVRFWWDGLGPISATEIRRRRIARMRQFHHWHWRLNELFVRINGETHDLRRAAPT